MLSFLVVLLAWFFQAFTGFGAGIFIVGILSLFYNPKEVVVSSSLINFWGNLFVFLSLRSKSSPNFKLLMPLVLGSFLGIAISSKVLILISKDALRALIGIFILLLGIYDLLVQRDVLKFRLKESFRNGLFAGFLGGLFAGLVGMGGPPPVVYLNQVCKNVERFKMTLALYFSFNVLTRVFFYFLYGDESLWNTELILYSFFGVPLGIYLGLKLSEYVKPKVLKQIVSLSVLFLGVFLFIFSLK